LQQEMMRLKDANAKLESKMQDFEKLAKEKDDIAIELDRIRKINKNFWISFLPVFDVTIVW
jgi:uncharacterized protein YigA (DUF484 family)